jgi:hypothetical protein
LEKAKAPPTHDKYLNPARFSLAIGIISAIEEEPLPPTEVHAYSLLYEASHVGPLE